jgi:hypothetical protein
MPFDTIKQGPLVGYAPESALGLDATTADIYASGLDLQWQLVGGGSSTAQGGPSADRPISPITYQSYFDTTLGLPVWWTGSQWVNAAGVTS